MGIFGGNKTSSESAVSKEFDAYSNHQDAVQQVRENSPGWEVRDPSEDPFAPTQPWRG